MQISASNGLKSSYKTGSQSISTTAYASSVLAKSTPRHPSDAYDTSLFSGLFGDSSSSRVTTPLSEPLEGVEIRYEPQTQAVTTSTTTMSNGLKIATENTPGATATIGLYVNAGSIYENGACMGVGSRYQFKPQLEEK